MEHIKEHILERYAVHPGGELAPDSVRQHLAECSLCREAYEFFRDIHQEFSKLHTAESPRTKKLLDKLFPPTTVIHLFSVRLSGEFDDSGEGHVTVLAAMSSEREDKRFVSVATLVSEKDNALVRIMFDREKKAYRVYASLDDPARRSHAIVAIPEMSLQMITDVNGQATFDSNEDMNSPDWSSVHAVLRLPVASIPVSLQAQNTEGEFAAIVHSGTGSSVAFRYSDEKLAIDARINSDEKIDFSEMLLTTEHGKNVLVALEQGEATIKWNPQDRNFTFRYYH